jgi:autoinducer 2-degrading protein
MIVNVVHIHVKPDNIMKFVEVTTANHLESVRETGNLRFDIIQQADDPSRFLLYEAYETEDAAANHKTTPHYLRWRETVKDFMAEARFGLKYNVIQPKDPEKW